MLRRNFFYVWACISTVVGLGSCAATYHHSHPTVNVGSYARSDGTYVSAYMRRAPGVAAADRYENNGRFWVRALIFIGWGCGLWFAACTDDRMYRKSISPGTPPNGTVVNADGS